ncbi:MAG TPA: lactate utilization protein [Thermomicrobiales bacterium]|nr:lactate utilization protein [Thermomicrobiales bacterium]
MTAEHEATGAARTIAGPGPDALGERFAARAGSVGARVHRVAGIPALAALVAELAGDGRVVVAPALAKTHDDLLAELVARGMDLGAVDAADPAATFAGVAVGVSEAVLGLAETGSLVVADAFADRLVRMLVPKHVAVLGARWVVPGLDEAGAFLRETVAGGEGAPSHYVSFITGPSRTADIEMSLTVGAHGPAELHIAILEGAGE